jgi:AcrR family transcriptional regulator
MAAIERPSTVERHIRGLEDPSRSQMAELQRARLLSAMSDVAAERGATNLSVAHVVERSGVSRRTFYELFDSSEECFLAAFEQALSLASRQVLAAYESQRGWCEQVRAGLIALLDFLDAEPILGKLLIVEALSGGPRALERRSEVLAGITRAIDAGRGATGAVAGPASPLTAEGVVGGAFGVIHARVAQAGQTPLIGLTGPLMSMIVMPYLGAAAARRELDRPLPRLQAERRRAGGVPFLVDPFKAAGMRLTYRTVRALSAIADTPGASNRTIARAAGIEDQGQISKMLARLGRIGLVANSGLGPGTGAPNAWTLTAKGRQVVQAIESHSTSDTSTEGERTCIA